MASSKPAPPPAARAAVLAPMLERLGRPSPRPGGSKGVRRSVIITWQERSPTGRREISPSRNPRAFSVKFAQ